MRCMAESYCRARDEHGYPAESYSIPLCFWCLEAAERDVRALPLDYRDLEQHIPLALGRRSNGMPAARQVDAALPLNEDAFDLQREIWWAATAWEEVVRDAAGLPMVGQWAKRRRDGVAVVEAVRVLAPRLDVLAKVVEAEMWGYPGTSGTTLIPGWRGVLDLAALHRRARGALGLSTPRRELCQGVPCRACGLKALYRQDEGAVRCDGCARLYDRGDYETWLADLTGDGPESVIPAA